METKVRSIPVFRVHYRVNNNYYDDYVLATSAQKAVDEIRKDTTAVWVKELEILEVAKIVQNWE